MLNAKDFMTKDVITISPESTVKELAGLLIKHKISGAPVVDNENNLIGIITENDLIRQNKRLHIPTVIRLFDAFFVLGSDKIEGEIKNMTATKVDEICTRDVISITEDTTLEQVATIMSQKNVHLLPVVKDKVVVGIIGKADVVRALTSDASK